jgi:hypothetical protein
MESIKVDEGVGGNTDYTMSDPSPGRGLSIIDFAYTNRHPNPNDNITNNPHVHSAPTSPRGTRTIDIDTGLPNLNRSSSAEPSTSFLHNLEISPDPEPKPDLEMDMGMGMGMEWIDRKPSIYTLINSQPASPFISHPHTHTQTHLNAHASNTPGTFSLGLDLGPSGSGNGGTESPTLFGETNVHELADSMPIPNGDQEMGRGRRMSFMRSSLSLGMNMSIPSAGGVGRLSLGGSEGLGLGLGLEHAT